MREPSSLSNASKIEAERRQEENRTFDKTKVGVSHVPVRTYQPTVKQQLFAAGFAILCLFALVVEATNKDKPDANEKLTKNKSSSKNNHEKSCLKAGDNSTSIRTQNYYKDSFFPLCKTVSAPLFVKDKSNQICSERHSQKSNNRMSTQDLYKDVRRFINDIKEKMDNGINLKRLPYLIDNFKNHCRASDLRISDVIISHLDKLVLPGVIREEKIHTTGDVWVELDGRFSIAPPCNGVLGYIAITRPLILPPELFAEESDEKSLVIKLTNFFQKTQTKDRKYLAPYTYNFAQMFLEKTIIVEKLFAIVAYHDAYPSLNLIDNMDALENLYTYSDKIDEIFDTIESHVNDKSIKKLPDILFHDVFASDVIKPEWRDKIIQLLRNDFLGCVGNEGYAIELFDAYIKLYGKKGLEDYYWEHMVLDMETRLNRKLTTEELQNYSFFHEIVVERMALSLREMLKARGEEVLSELRIFNEEGKNRYINKIRLLIQQSPNRTNLKSIVITKMSNLLKTMMADGFIRPIVKAFFMNDEFELLATDQAHIGDFRKLEQYENIAGLSDSSRRIYVSLSDEFPDNIVSYKDSLYSKIAITAEEMTHAIDRFFHLSDSDTFKEIYDLDLEWVEHVGSIFQEIANDKNSPLLDKEHKRIFVDVLKMLEKHTGDRKEAIKYANDMLFDAYKHTIRAYGDYRAEYLAKIQAFKTKWGDDLTEYLFPGAIRFYHENVVPICNNFVLRKFTYQLDEIEVAIVHYLNTQESVQTSSASILRPFF